MINEEDTPIRLTESRRRRIANIDNTLISRSEASPLGKAFQSTTFTSEIPDRPHILSEAKGNNSGFQTMITVTVEPVEGTIPELENSSPYEVLIQYFNRTNSAIKITDKNNISFTLPKPRFWNHAQTEYLIVRKIHRFNNAEIAQSVLFNHQINQRYLSVNNDELRTIMMKLRDAQKDGTFKNYNAYTEIVIDRMIPIALFHHHASIFVADLDMLFCLDGVDIGTPHPTSQDAVLRGEVLEQISNRRLTGAFYEIIDNENQYSSRYVCLGKQVVQVPINRDPGKASGIYYTAVDNINSKQLQISLQRCDLSSAEQLGIYQTREEAETKGHVNESHKLEMVRLERDIRERDFQNKQMEQERDEALNTLAHERKVRETNLDIEKTTLGYAKDRLVNEATLIETVMKLNSKLEQDEIERKSLQRKDHYEERSAYRKDTSEIFKWAPSFISSGAAIATVVMLQRNKKKD